MSAIVEAGEGTPRVLVRRLPGDNPGQAARATLRPAAEDLFR